MVCTLYTVSVRISNVDDDFVSSAGSAPTTTPTCGLGWVALRPDPTLKKSVDIVFTLKRMLVLSGPPLGDALTSVGGHGPSSGGASTSARGSISADNDGDLVGIAPSLDDPLHHAFIDTHSLDAITSILSHAIVILLRKLNAPWRGGSFAST